MSRVLTAGAETELNESGMIAGGTGSITRDTANQRSPGAGCWACGSGASNLLARVDTPTGITLNTASTSYFYRAYLKFGSLPTAATATVIDAGSISVRVTSGGKVRLWNDTANSQIGSDSAATLVTGQFYRFEVKFTISSGGTQVTLAELLLDGVTVATSGALTLGTSTFIQAGWTTAPGASLTVYVDDIALNTSAGATNNTYPGAGQIVALVPASDSAVGTGWTNDNAATTNLFNSVKSVPPAGIADTTSGGGGHQIRNATSNANVNYDANMTSYSTAGVGASDTINAIVTSIITGAPVVTSAKQGTFGLVSNPTVANVSLSNGGQFWDAQDGVAAGTFPTGWMRSLITTDTPTVTIGTQPVMRVTQVTSSTRIAMVCSMAILVDYTPAAVAAATPRPVVVGQAVQRAATR